MSHARVVAVVNQKGGVGKTTTVFHLARAAARRGRRILVIDLDPQANSTAALAEVEPDQVGIADVLKRPPEVLADVLVEGPWGIDVAPSSGEPLAWVRDQLVGETIGRERRLATALASLSEYDLVLIDCAPAVDQLTINALVAAQLALIVTEAKLFSANGLGSLLNTIHGVRTNYHAGLRIAGIVVNRLEQQTVSSAHWLKEIDALAAELGVEVYSPKVPKRVAIADSVEAGIGLDEWGGVDDLAAIYDGYLDNLERALA
ncbi:ParA family protein [Tessaracoccus sp. MC1679]|nr:ParA family protein [Tessaracoccus sp. MC1679]MBB1517466.1 ParA family protein [Tessaracoccus sp. MC1679]